MARRTRSHERPIPAHPYRDTALVYGVMAVLLVALALLTGGDAIRAVLVAVVFFVASTAWTWWKFRGRIRRRDAVGAFVPAEEIDAAHSSDNGTGAAT